MVSQTNRLSGDQDFITVSSGGNDVGLKDLLNECVYTWNPRVGCAQTIEESKRKIEQVLPGNLDTLYAAVAQKLAAHGMAYITSYARFFDETTSECDRVSWHWFKFPINFLNYQYLTQQRRRDLNELTDMVNQKIHEAAHRAGDKFMVVNYDGYFGALGGRYCMPSVSEPAPNRIDLLFYQVSSRFALTELEKNKENQNQSIISPQDKTDENPSLTGKRRTKQRRQPVPVPQGGQEDEDSFPESTFEGQILKMMIDGREKLINDSNVDPNAPDFETLSLSSIFAPDSWARVFHPMVQGHAFIANQVMYHMTARQEVQLGNPKQPEVFDLQSSDSCPLPIIPTSDGISNSPGAGLTTPGGISNIPGAHLSANLPK